jgi:mannose-1-phosphate guanylyltransferase/mannose-6-phosphate isomerase
MTDLLVTTPAGHTCSPWTEPRPWGSFTVLALNETASVKLITVEPGQRLSLQRHRLRAETWLDLDPGLEVVVDDRTWVAEPGEVVEVPRGAVHRMGATSGTVRVLEVVLDPFDEDDIERLDDLYGRR